MTMRSEQANITKARKTDAKRMCALRESDFTCRVADDGTRTWAVVWQGSEIKIVRFGGSIRAFVNNVPFRRQSTGGYALPPERRFRSFASALAAIKTALREIEAARLGGRYLG